MWPRSYVCAPLKMACRLNKRTSVARLLAAALIVGIAVPLLLYHVSGSRLRWTRTRSPEPPFLCRQEAPTRPRAANEHATGAGRPRVDARVLLFVETPLSELGRELRALLDWNRIRYRAEVAGRGALPALTSADRGRYAVFVFESAERYLAMERWNRDIVNMYCREYDVGVVLFATGAAASEPRRGVELQGFPMFATTGVPLRDYELNGYSSVLRVLRAGETHRGRLPARWTTFNANHSTYETVAHARAAWTDDAEGAGGGEMRAVVVEDKGFFDGIRRVWFGQGFGFWLHRPLLLDALSFLSHGKLSITLDRYMLVDIDDIFVGEKSRRMTREDVKALLESQERLRKRVDGFRFNLGFSGKYFHAGTKEEDEGDDMLLELKDDFWWFPHMWGHTKPHLLASATLLEAHMQKNLNFAKPPTTPPGSPPHRRALFVRRNERSSEFSWFGHMWSHAQPHQLTVATMQAEMRQNRDFAVAHNISTNTNYSVAPHHSGVYPVHEPLYEAWRKLLGIQVTSTEEYPHLRPVQARRGFIYKGIKVLPRQLCGLFTHTVFLDQYPGGKQVLINSIQGGELFQTILSTPVSIFMTHLSNYGNDRLALYTFESAVKFTQCWTNLQLKTETPQMMAERYFKMYPEEEDPVWQNPCNDKRHRDIWAPNKTCSRLPNFLVIGPQKTGTTALYTFLSMHPSIMSNSNSDSTFEEVQFFNGNNYYRGLDWYMNFFPKPAADAGPIYLFEKSATYFESEVVPARAHALLPNAKIITLLLSPSRRAYSWYQHQRAHGDAASLNYSFYDVARANVSSPRALRSLQHRCLNPGLYARHLEHWLEHYSPNQLLILDGDQLRLDPVHVMEIVQRFLKAKPYYPYDKNLKYDPNKGFYCQVINDDHTKCLGRSKGRLYAAMEPNAEKALSAFYRADNVALARLLARLGHARMLWLDEELKKS